MSQFTNFSSIKIPTDNSCLFELGEDLVYERYYEGSGLYIVAPAGFKSNFASLPLAVQLFWKPYDPRWIKSSIIHDELFGSARTLREFQDANDVFYEAMQVEGTPKWIATLFYLAVSLKIRILDRKKDCKVEKKDIMNELRHSERRGILSYKRKTM